VDTNGHSATMQNVRICCLTE